MTNVGTTYATSENTVSTPPPTISNEMPPPHTKKRMNRSEVWKHFIVSSEEEQNASSKYCDTKIKYNNGTSSMHAHVSRCLIYKRQRTLSSMTSVEEHVGSPLIVKFDQEAIRRAMVKMFINMEIPFRKVEHESFHEFMSLASPRFQICSHITLARDVLKLWDSERMILKISLSLNCRRVCLTTDMWTSSCQKLSYMCVTAHFIDNNWHLQKKILTFCQVTSHTGDAMCATMKMCLNSWGLNRVLSLTVDNASSNDVGVERLKRRLLSRNSLVMSGNHFHMRCRAHILNLVVKEGLKDIDGSIGRICHVVWYARSSPVRLAKFKACIDEESMDCKCLVWLDIETHWNSTYLMLVSASKHERTFEELSFRDKNYFMMLPSYLTSNIYMFEILGIGKSIVDMCASEDEHLRSVAQKMKKKYDKYWRNHEKLNMLLLIVLVFDPRRNIRLVDWMVRRYYNKDDADALKANLETGLKSIYEEYCVGFMPPQGNSDELQVFGGVSDPYGIAEFYISEGCDNADNELTTYLGEKLEHNMEINVLDEGEKNKKGGV
ncbi:hypothetical protein KIW84_065844 [Lathyrus oleraceus]|uniref:hAT-like transposase RNase-H fold domain-containing protein n=1 Tax=Pisum sativum TaxID=3888 RepID=A0A9D5AAT7_PEA|nr:hypothetical protein KIW84_065844 [Pisum sativum]